MRTNTLALIIVAGSAGAASASTAFDQNVNPGVIFGSGNANGSFTTGTANNTEIGLRAKLRYDANGQPQNIFNSNGDGSYTFNVGGPAAPVRPEWNFEWSINTDLSGTSGVKLNAFSYVLSLDGDPSAGTNFFSFDPINVAFADHSLGNNSTTAASDIVSTPVNYASNIGLYSVAQNSWSYAFFAVPGFSRNTPGLYTISLAAFDVLGTEINRSTIVVNVVPTPGAAGLLGLAGLIVARRRR
ncbi:MAG: PEP-CTERM sorting domain-containing protein [Planctomycetota bacterium]|nr:PEP-CTERM sorting domain-containing protein [Planctomycetota bacterium]